jgi:putative hydrolase of the HAD superfamily
LLIIFDLDDTLIDTTAKLTPIIFKKALKMMIDEGLPISNEKKEFKKLLEIDKTSINSKESIKKFLSEINANEKFYDIAINVMIQPIDQDVKVFTTKNAKKTLKYLSNSHTLAIVSMGKEKFQFDKIQKAGIDTSIFSKIVITQKEDKGFYYKKIIEQLNFSYQNTYVCGDKIDVDLIPAKEIGCKTIHMRYGRGKYLPQNINVDYTINLLDEIIGIVKKREKICL